MGDPDAVVVGAGPNGLAAAVTLAQAGFRVQVFERSAQAGGGCRTDDELTLPGFSHDVCSAVHPMALASPFFRSLDLEAGGARFVHPEVPLAHPLDGGRVAVVHRSVNQTALALGEDGRYYRRIIQSLAHGWQDMVEAVMAPIRGVPRHPLALAQFGLRGLLPASVLVAPFRGPEARAIFAGTAAHAAIPLNAAISGGFGVLLVALAHAVGWPFVEGGSKRLTDALVRQLEALEGRLYLGHEIFSVDELPSGIKLLDVGTRQLLAMAGDRLAPSYRRSLAGYRYGPGVCKVDWALDGPVPWTAEICRTAGTVHVGGPYEEIAAGEEDVAAGRHPTSPFVILAQPSIVDASRAPAGKQTLWGYCHVPAGSAADMSGAIERQIERFAPGFIDRILVRHVRTADEAERDNPNQVGGDLNGGTANFWQALLRPTWHGNPYRVPFPGLYLCSASTPPGGGVHGMCGRQAASCALGDQLANGGAPSLPRPLRRLWRRFG